MKKTFILALSLLLSTFAIASEVKTDKASDDMQKAVQTKAEELVKGGMTHEDAMKKAAELVAEEMAKKHAK